MQIDEHIQDKIKKNKKKKEKGSFCKRLQARLLVFESENC